MSLYLPVELILLILSHLDRKADRRTLKSLALTSSAFVRPCQSILLSHISLTSSNAGRRLLDLFSSSPWIATFVKRLTISESRPGSENWLQNDLKLVEALRRINLKGIQGLTLCRQPGATWEGLSAPVKRVIVDICRSPALVDLDLLWAPLALVNVCGPSLKQLRLFQCSGTAASDATPNPYSPKITLDSLELWSDSGAVALFLLDPSGPIRLDALQTLEVQMYSVEYHPHLQSLMESSQESLQTLSFRPAPNISNPTEDLLSISDYPNLTTLELTVAVTAVNLRGAASACFSWVAMFICSIPPSNAIQTLRLNLYLGDERGGSTTAGLREIGRFVDTPGALPHLQAIEIEVHSESRRDTKMLRAWALGALAISAARDLLYVEAFYDPQD